MPVLQDELWKHPGNPGMIVVTSHACVEKDGKLFLGYIPAEEAVRRIPRIEYQCGQEVLAHARDGVYGFLPVRPSRAEERIVGFGLFQTQVDLDGEADSAIIRYSMDGLRLFTEQNPEVKIRMNFPAPHGQDLPVEEISRLLVPLPPTVTICHQGEVQTSIHNDFPGFKNIYIQVESMLQDGHYNEAVEYLMRCGFDIQSAYDQANAVQRIIRERHEREDERYRQKQAKNAHLFR